LGIFEVASSHLTSEIAGLAFGKKAVKKKMYFSISPTCVQTGFFNLGDDKSGTCRKSETSDDFKTTQVCCVFIKTKHMGIFKQI